jgi:hypothetical protein
MNADVTWEAVTSNCPQPSANYPGEMTRARVPGGWLVCGWIQQAPVMAFVPDQWGGWKPGWNSHPSALIS